MAFQTPMPEAISSDEAEALARFVHDLETRMKRVSEVLQERGTPSAALLANSITHDLKMLETALSQASA